MPDGTGPGDEGSAGTGDPSGSADRPATTRRRFLAATGAASVTAVAGCSGGDGGATTARDGPTTGRRATGATPATGTPGAGTTDAGTTRTTAPPTVEFDGYPYGVGERRVEDARRAMEDAGYGPDDRFELRVVSWPSHAPSFGTLVDALESAHVTLTINGNISRVVGDMHQGELDAITAHGVLDYPAVESVLRRIHPPNTDYGNEAADGLPLFWTEESSHGAGRAVATEAFDRLRNAQDPTDRAAETRAGAVRRIEEALWNDVPVLPYALPVHEALWRDEVDWRPHGSLGKSAQKNNRLSVQGGGRVLLPGALPDTLDPVAGGGWRVLADVFDAPTTYRDGTTAVEPLLIDDYGVSDDFTTYSFTLKEGVQFHGDHGEVTADDVVYSLRRLAESEHSREAALLTEILGVEHDPVPDTGEGYQVPRAEPGTLAVRATGRYRLEVDLAAPFAHTLSVLAFPACSVIPEGIVGDVRGYDGEMDYETFAREAPVGCGPFVLDDYVRFERASVDRFSDYHDHVADLDGIDWEGLDGGQAYRAFVEGRIDFAPLREIPVEEYDPEKVTVDRVDARGRRLGTYGPVESGETVEFARIPGLVTDLVAFNCERVPMAVRRALAYVLDQDAFVDERFETPPLPAYHLTPPNLFPGGPASYADHYRG